jgi:hypothetical protein
MSPSLPPAAEYQPQSPPSRCVQADRNTDANYLLQLNAFTVKMLLRTPLLYLFFRFFINHTNISVTQKYFVRLSKYSTAFYIRLHFSVCLVVTLNWHLNIHGKFDEEISALNDVDDYGSAMNVVISIHPQSVFVIQCKRPISIPIEINRQTYKYLYSNL